MKKDNQIKNTKDPIIIEFNLSKTIITFIIIGILIPQEIKIATKIKSKVLINTLKKLLIPVSPPTIAIKSAKTPIKTTNVLI